MTKNVIFRMVFLSLGILLVVGGSYGQTQVNGAASGNWSSTSSWSGGVVPNNGGGNTYDVTLLSSPAVVITLDINPTIDTLTLDSGSELTTNAGTTLTTTGLTNGGYINFGNGNTLTVNGATTNTGEITLYNASTANFNGNFTNSSAFYTDGKSTATVTGTFTNSDYVDLQTSGDVLNVGTLTNNSEIVISTGATLNITGGGSGITAVGAGSTLYVEGTLNVINGGTPSNALASLTTVAGSLIWENGQTLTDTPTGGTLTINSGGNLETYNASKLSVTGNVSNSGGFYTDGGSTVTITGTLTNSNFVDLQTSGDVLNVGSLTNNSEIIINTGTTLNITGGGSGITAVAAGSTLDVAGTFNVINGGTPSNALASLTSVSGSLAWENGKTLTDTPTGGTLTINSGGNLEIYTGSTLSVTGNVSNSGGFYTNGGSTVTISGTLTNNDLVYLESSGDVLNVGTLTNNDEIIIDAGATLNITGGTAITTVAASSTLTVAGTLNVINGGTPSNALASLTTVSGSLAWENGKTLTDTPAGGTLTINSGGNLETYNASTLSVTGNVSNSGGLYTNGASTVTISGALTNSNLVYLETSGDVLNVGSLTNNGEIIIDAGATLNITGGVGITTVAAGSTLDVAGTLNVINGGTPSNALASLTTVSGALAWENGKTLTDTPTGGTLTINSGGALETYNASTLSVTGNVSNSGSMYTDGASTVTISGTLTNGNLVYLESSGDVLNVGALTNNHEIIIDAGATLNITLGVGITTVAAGSTLDVAGTLNVINGGTPSNALASLMTVAGTLAWENGQTLTDTPTGGGTLTIDSGGALEVYNASTLSVTGNLSNSGNIYTESKSTVTVSGTLTNSGSIYLQSSGDVLNAGTLTNTDTVFLYPGATLNLTGAASTNSKTITLDSGGILEISAAKVTISGDGIIDLIGAGNIIEGAASSDVLTLAKGGTIEGSGNIGNNLMGLNNQGIINAQQSSSPLIIQAVGTTSNSGTMEATLGATLQLDAGTYTQTSTGAIIASETGSALSTVNLESGVVINDGKLTLTGTTATADLIGASATLTLNGVTISGTGKLVLPDGSTTTLMGTISNTSTIDLNGATAATTLTVGSLKTSLTGTGKIILSNYSGNVITGTSGGSLTTANTIEGAGNIGGGMIGLTNTGTIETVAHDAQLEIDAGSAGFSNQGTVEAVASTTLYIDNTANQFLNYNSGTDTLTGGTYIVDGIMNVDGLNITIDAASITLSGTAAKLENSTTSTSALANLNTIAAGGTLDLISQTFDTTGNFTNNGTLDVGASSKFVVLAADTLTNFSGTTLTGGVYNITGTLEFTGANIVNNDASITLTGTKALIENSTGSTNGLLNFANNEAGATFALASAAKFTTANNFTNSGTLNVGTGSLFAVGTTGADNLTNYASNTLTGGTYIVTGTGQIQFNNEGTLGGIKTNDASITLSGTGSTASFIDQSDNNMLANFATNSSGALFDVTGGLAYTTSGSFTNNGTLTVGSSTSKFIVNSADTLTNFSGTTLTGGTYNVTGLLEFAGANIVSSAASITLTGTTSAIENSTAGNGLANFANNTSTGSFTLAGNRSFTTVGAFTNAGVMDINKGSTFTVTGATNTYSQSAGSTTVDGTLVVNAASMVDITGGSLFGATGSITGNVDLTGGVVNPGDGANLIGELKITGTYTQGSAGATTIDLGGKTAITQYSVLDITKAATLNGTLNVTLVNGFTPVAGTNFTILDYLSETGAFTALNLPTVSGDHWTVTYNAKDVVLALVAGPGPAVVIDNLTSDPSSSSSAQSTMHGAPATRVSTFGGAPASASNTHAPVAILSRVTCFAARILGSGSCGTESVSTVASRGEMPAVASAGGNGHQVHNNIMVVTRTISSAPAGPSRESSASATAMARLYVCAYMPSTVARNMGCN